VTAHGFARFLEKLVIISQLAPVFFTSEEKIIMSRDVVVLSAVRSAIGAFGGSLADMDASELAG